MHSELVEFLLEFCVLCLQLDEPCFVPVDGTEGVSELAEGKLVPEGFRLGKHVGLLCPRDHGSLLLGG